MSITYLKQNDTRPIDATLTRDGAPIDLTGASVTFTMRHRYGDEVVSGPCSVIDPATEGKVRFVVTEGDLETTGPYRAEYEVTHSSGEVETVPNDGYIAIEVLRELD